jgi:PfaB family protein
MTAEEQNDRPGIAQAGRMALVGMDVVAAGQDGLAAFERVLYQGSAQVGLPDALDLNLPAQDLTIFDLAPADAGGLPREDSLLLRTAARAWQDSGLAQGSGAAPRMAFLFSRGRDLAHCTAQAAGMSPATIPTPFEDQFPTHVLHGPLLNLSAEPNPLAAGLIEAQRLLDGGGVDVVLLAAAALLEDFAGMPQIAAARVHPGALNFGLDQAVDGWSFGEGAAAVALVSEEFARSRGLRLYALLDALGWAPKDLPGLKKNLVPTLVSADTIAQSCRLAYEKSAFTTADSGCLEILASGFTPLDSAEAAGLAKVYQSAASGLSCALSSATANAGYLFNAAGLVALVKAALCVYLRVLPAAPGWTQPKKAEWLSATCLYVSSEARTWFLAPSAPRRLAALNAIGRDGSCAHLLLCETADTEPHPAGFLAQSPGKLLPVAANNPAELESALRALRTLLRSGIPYDQAARQAFLAYQQAAGAVYALCITAADRAEAEREIDFALRDLPGVFAQDKTWQTPQGSFFTPQPVGGQGGVAFVYPGAFNSYIGLGRDLFKLFPQLYPRAAALTAQLGATIQDQKLYPRSQCANSKDELTALEAQLNDDPIAMITTGSLIAVLFTMIVRDIFRVSPTAAFGYSLGEIAMLFGTGVWSAADETSAALRASPLFRTRLSGPQNAVRAAWGLPEETGAGLPSSQPLWANYFLMAPAERVREAVAGETRVYLTHVNTPRQVVIGGDPQACQRVIALLKCTSLKAPFDFALHCDAIRAEYAAMVSLHTWPVSTVPVARLYTAADNCPLPVEQAAIAEKIAGMLSSSLDFTALVRQVYADGARVFIELGANANCSKWIEETLKGSPFVSVAINRKGADDHSSILRMLARLVSHRVPLDLSPLYP